jgi:hypothetical protein
MKDDPAFPLQFNHKTTGEGFFVGLTKRELFAMAAMQGLVSTVTIGREEYAKMLCGTAVEYADALLAELEKERT